MNTSSASRLPEPSEEANETAKKPESKTAQGVAAEGPEQLRLFEVEEIDDLR